MEALRLIADTTNHKVTIDLPSGMDPSMKRRTAYNPKRQILGSVDPQRVECPTSACGVSVTVEDIFRGDYTAAQTPAL